MTGKERGILLLTSRLGDPERRVLTLAQLRNLSRRAELLEGEDPDRQLEERDLLRLGYGEGSARRILELLSQEELLEHYLRRGRDGGCVPLTRVSAGYPRLLRRRLGPECPGCLWLKGDSSILNTPGISLVGSRELREENRSFARAVGAHAAAQGLTLISGNARGADRAAQESCLAAGGRVISILADDLRAHPPRENVLYLSEDSFDEPFSGPRALSRNRCIHALGRVVFVAQSDLGKGGTWDGTVKNLRFRWSPVAVFRDGSQASKKLEEMGAFLMKKEDLKDFTIPEQDQLSFF